MSDKEIMEDRVKLALEALEAAKKRMPERDSLPNVETEAGRTLDLVDQAIAALSAPEEPSGEAQDDVCGHCGKPKKDHAPEAYCPSPVFATLTQFTPVELTRHLSASRQVVPREAIEKLKDKVKNSHALITELNSGSNHAAVRIFMGIAEDWANALQLPTPQPVAGIEEALVESAVYDGARKFGDAADEGMWIEEKHFHDFALFLISRLKEAL